jgi:nucleoside-diphosphate-sugar epimerase
MSVLFVAGATGYTGRAVVAAGCAAGHTVVAHIRPGSPSGDRLAPELEAFGARVDRTPWDDAALTAAVVEAAPDAVFGLLGTTRAKASAAARRGEDATYEAVDRDLTLMLLRAARACPRPPRFVYLSSLGADLPRGNRYLQARHDVEQALMAQADLPWTIARPGFLTGPDREERRAFERVTAVVGDALMGALAAVGAPGLRDRYGSLSAADAAQGLVRVALDPAMAGRFVESPGLRAPPRG